MAVPFATILYKPVFDFYAVPVIINPVASQPNGGTYSARGILDTNSVDVVAMDGSIYSDSKTELDILETEFTVLPIQNDRVTIPADCNGVNKGEYEIIDTDSNGGGETCLTLRKWVTAKPPPSPSLPIGASALLTLGALRAFGGGSVT